MDSKMKENISSLFDGVKAISSTRQVVGDPYTVGDTTIIPFLETSVGAGFGEFNGLLRKMRHYQPYYSDLEYSLPSPEDIRYAREIKAPCHLDYCGKSYRFDNLVPEGYKDPHISIIRHFVKSKNPNYEPYCK